jgi:hypothetical protein
MLASHKHACSFPPEIEVPLEGVNANVLFRLLLGSSPVSLTASYLSQPETKHEEIRLALNSRGATEKICKMRSTLLTEIEVTRL